MATITDKLELIRYLIKFGYLAAGHFQDVKKIEDAISQFLAFFGLTDADNLDAVIQRLLTMTRCGCSDRQSMALGACKWTLGNDANGDPVPVKVFINDLPGLSRSDWMEVFSEATAAWEAVCNIAFAVANTKEEANIIVVDARIDGPSNVLADMELPCGIQKQRALQFRFDREAWSVKPGVAMRIPASTVAKHELGHAIGLEHIGVNEGVALLNPMLNPRVNDPTPVDIARVQAIYGPPRKAPIPPTTPPVPPTTPPTAPDETELVLRIKGGLRNLSIDGRRII